MLTTRFVNGAPNWIDIGATDIGRASAFYGALLGWRFESAGPDAGGYGFFRLGGGIAAGGMQTTPEQGTPSWTVYFRSPDAEATCGAAEQAHGEVVFPPMEVRDQGTMAILADPAGAPFGVWQPARLEGLEVAGAPGALCWVELHTPDEAAAAAFYHAALGLETSAVSLPGGTYTQVGPAGAGEDDAFGGVVPPADDPTEAGSGAYWLPYFEVMDVDAVVGTARELGGAVRLAATDIEGVGRIARLADPDGARFAVIRTAPRQR
ncbi:VOC family protein [Streptomyces sp. NPDC059894]|uniref:VOC family protein n=1 Tax=unclassified Streptomyces TaxID=2593676 RepID=UPI003653B427